jgi:hypothetical protein
MRTNRKAVEELGFQLIFLGLGQLISFLNKEYGFKISILLITVGLLLLILTLIFK